MHVFIHLGRHNHHFFHGMPISIFVTLQIFLWEDTKKIDTLFVHSMPIFFWHSANIVTMDLIN